MRLKTIKDGDVLTPGNSRRDLNSVDNALEEKTGQTKEEPEIDQVRRAILGTTAALATGGLAGCNTGQSATPYPEDTPEENEQTPEERETLAPEENEQTQTPLENGIIIEDSLPGTINLEPLQENADYADAEVFNRYNGENTIRIDLETAWQQTHGAKFEYSNTLRRATDQLSEFVENYQDPEWRQEMVESAFWEGREDPFDMETFNDAESVTELMGDSGLQMLYHAFQVDHFGIGTSSNNAPIQAAIYQEIVDRIDEEAEGYEDMSYSSDAKFVAVQGNNLDGGGHTMVYATEDAVDPEGEIEGQDVYVLESVPMVEYDQVSEVETSDIINDEYNGAETEMPFEEDASNENNSTLVEIGKVEETAEADYTFSDEMTDEYDSILREPHTGALKPFMDAAVVAGHIGTQEEIEMETSMETMEAL